MNTKIVEVPQIGMIWDLGMYLLWEKELFTWKCEGWAVLCAFPTRHMHVEWKDDGLFPFGRGMGLRATKSHYGLIIMGDLE